MDEQEAIKQINYIIDCMPHEPPEDFDYRDRANWYLEDKNTRESYKMAISALEKQIPKKPKQIALKQGIIITNYECPVCGCRRLGHGFDLDKCYCPECGQKLDWSD